MKENNNNNNFHVNPSLQKQKKIHGLCLYEKKNVNIYFFKENLKVKNSCNSIDISMSVFPACSEANSLRQEEGTKNEEEREGTSWLSNPSFSLHISQIPLPDEVKYKTVADCSTNIKQAESYGRKKLCKHKKLKTHHKHKNIKTSHHESEIIPSGEKNNFYEDKLYERGNLSIPTLPRSIVPLYHVLHKLRHVNFKYASKKKKRQHRYYKHVWELSQSEKIISTFSSESTASTSQKEEKYNEFSPRTRLEEELTKKTGQYNKALTEQPANVELWLKYVRFQDTVWQFEKTYCRGDSAKGVRVTAERKLSILDKALQHNPDSEILLKERISVAESVFVADDLSRELGDMVEKQPSNLTLWNGYISSTQCSLALCSVSSVTQLYKKAMTRLRRGATRPTEEKILALLHDYGLFLRQAGLWEQLWFLLSHYLELNLPLPHSNYFQIISLLSEKLVAEREEEVLTSRLPLCELWLRVEQLREAAHWLPWASEQDCEDPQRLVFSDDISALLHPISSVSLLPHLVTIVLTLLKVPFLPCRDSAMRIICPQQKPWHLDAVEMLLPVFFPVGTVEIDCVELLKDVCQLAVGPQYLSQKLGQEQYLDFVVKVFQLCADCLMEPARTAFCVWWLRFERLLLILDRLDICKLPHLRKKKVKSLVKDFLKQDRNRNTLLFYREYALLEKELGNYDGACKILTTAITAQPGCVPVVAVLNVHEKAGLCSLYRTLCELYLCRANTADKQNAVSALMALGLGISLHNTEIPSMEQLVPASEKFYHIATELMSDSDTEVAASVSGCLLPDFCVDWISCHAWLLFLTHSPQAAGALLEDVLIKMPPVSNSTGTTVTVRSCQREALFESYVSILHHHCNEVPGSYSILKDVLHRGMKEFPSNLYFMATAAKLESGAASPWWMLKRYFNDAGSLMAHFFMVLIARLRQTRQQRLNLQTHNYLQIPGPVVLDESAINNVRALFTVLEKLPLSRRSPLIWRLYLRFLYDHGTEDMCKTAFYRAVEECPWVKILYMDAAKYVPQELPQVQDLIIEKELRLHVTPEELDILRCEPS